MNREFLMLAKTYKDQDVAGWYVSEKLDGQRAFWDGGASRGESTDEVPWANLDRGYRPVATGLWSRYGNVICAPSWFLDLLPAGVCLDGELYVGVNMLQTTRSIISRHEPDERWKDVRFCIIDAPGHHDVFMDGRVNNPNYKKVIDSSVCLAFMDDYGVLDHGTRTLELLPRFIEENVTLGEHVRLMTQTQLPNSKGDSVLTLEQLLADVEYASGEGLILRSPLSFWYPKRMATLLKVKSRHDDEGIVVGYVWGHGKYEGMLGALILDWRGRRLELSGFTDAERELLVPAVAPGIMDFRSGISNYFKLGATVTFKYRGFTESGLPTEAAYYRKG